jgi:hypothetical protein
MSEPEGSNELELIREKLTRMADTMGNIVGKHDKDTYVQVKTGDLDHIAGILDDLAKRLGVAMEEVSDAPEIDLTPVITL